MITMKKIIVSLIYLFITVSITGCDRSPATPASAFKIIKKAILQKNWDKYWFMLSEKSKENFNEQVKYMQEHFSKLAPEAKTKMLGSMGLTDRQLQQLDGRTFFINAMTMRDNEQKKEKTSSLELLETSKIIYIEQNDSSAVLYIQDDQGHEEKVPLIREKNLWKLDFYGSNE